MIKVCNVSYDSFNPNTEITLKFSKADMFKFMGTDTFPMTKLFSAIEDKLNAKTPKVKRVIFNGPATIVFWNDGEKTVVKCRECEGGCIFDKDFDENPFESVARSIRCGFKSDPEKAIMAAMLKRLYKNYQDVLREALEGGEN